MSAWVCSDLHGYYDLYEQINNFIQPGDIIYFLGDACDRGPNGYALIKQILNNPQWKYLLGNHEDMFCKAARAVKKDLEELGCIDYHWGPVWQHRRNGGEVTLQDWINDGMPMDIIEKLENLEYTCIYINPNDTRIYLNHSGFMAPYFTRISKQSAIWDREQIGFYDYWSEKWPEGKVVHGHTGVPHIDHYLPEGTIINDKLPIAPYWYCDNHKCDIDMLTCVTDAAVLLNLDDWSYQVFHTSIPTFN